MRKYVIEALFTNKGNIARKRRYEVDTPHRAGWVINELINAPFKPTTILVILPENTEPAPPVERMGEVGFFAQASGSAK